MPRKSTKTKNIKLVEEETQINETNESTETLETTTTTEEVLSELTDTQTFTNITNTVDTEPNRGEIIDIEWEQVKPIFEFKARIEEMETYFANMCLHFEKEKTSIMSQITYGQNDLYMMAQQLQKSKNIDESLTYELKLPSSSGEKGFFVRKDD